MRSLATEEILRSLPGHLRQAVRISEPMSRHTSLRVGGPADLYLRVHSTGDLAGAALAAQRHAVPMFLLGEGSNICVSDRGIRGLVVHNCSGEISLGSSTHVAAGYPLIRLFQETMWAGLGGLEFAVGIPGTVGGAISANAGAYRRNIGPLVTQLDVVENAELRTVGPEWARFSYRHSRLRDPASPPAVVVGIHLALAPRPPREIHAEAATLQARRLRALPWGPSAGSLFKNHVDHDFAATFPGLDEAMRAQDTVPAGKLIQASGCTDMRVGGAAITRRHGNILVNTGGATASDVRTLADQIRAQVLSAFGVVLQEEVLYIGEWEWPGAY